ncbi:MULTISPECIES: ankyrin repeat domain-containing protein [unclassified Spiroplasma]|uniref:ankyrin repeat domain-containing protein n=1 Tax=unclassified Spiroplasma TaxID=2637901 RepID=UPI00313ABC4F
MQLLFVTSEAMRFGSYLKYFNHYYKDKDNPTKSSTPKPQTAPPSTSTTNNQVKFKNVPTNVQEILDGKINSLKWKDYEPQLIGGWIAASKNLEQKRKEIFKKLNERIIVSNFLSENNEELNKIFNKQSNWETNVKPKIKSIIENSQNKEYINLLNVILQYLKNLFIANQKEREFLQYNNNTSIPSVIRFINTDRNYNLIRSVIVQGNLDLLELIITKEPELINVNNNDLTFLQVAIANNKIDIVKWLLANANGANVNEEGKYDSTPLYTATFYGYLDIVKLLLEKGANVNARAKNVNIPLHVAIDRGYLDIVSLLLNNGANVNAKNNKGEPPLSTTIIFLGNLDIVKLLLEKGADVNIKDDFGQSPLHLAAHKGHLEIIKLLLAKGADVNAQDIKGITPLQKATDEGRTEVINLLENFVKIKNKIKSLNKQLEKTQNDGQKTKIKKDLQETQKELEQLLKIKLSVFITQTELGKIPDNSSQTILNAFIEKNEKLGILSGQLYVQNITDNSADIISPAPNVYTGTVKVTFTLAKKSSKPSNTQKTITEDEYKKQGARPKGSTVASKQSDNKKSSITNVSGAGIPQQNSGTQNKKTRVTNQNNLYDVPADGSCLFWSVATSYLVPVRNNNEEFRNRFIQLFGELQLSYLSYVQTLLQQFDLSNTNNFLQTWYQDATAHRLVRVVFRNRVVDYIERNLDNPTQSNANGKQAESFLSAIQISENEVVNNYLDRMRNINAWGGEIEILAMNNLLNANISVGTDIPYQPVNQNSNNNNIAIYYVELTKGSGIHNHYNFALTPEENRKNHPIAINDNQGNIPVVDTTKRPDNLPPTTPKSDTKSIKLPVDDHAQHHTILSKNNEYDDANQGNIINAPEPTTTPLQKDEYHFVDKKTEEKSLKNDENLEINLIKNNNKIKQNVPVVNKPINKNIINAQITATKAINKYNALSKEEKLKKLNEINRYYQTLSENDKKAFKEKLTNTGLAALSGGALTAYGTKMTVSDTAAITSSSVTNAEAMEMTPLFSTSTTESLAAAETITVTETAAVEGGVIAGETGTAAALAPETLGLSLVIGGLAIAGTWMYFAFHHHATSDIALPTSIHHNVYDNIEKWYKFLAHDKLKIKINKNTWNEIKQNKNSPANIIKIIKNKFVINDHSGWGGSVTNEDFNTFVKVIVLHFEQINGYFEILDNENDGFVIITNTEGDWLGIE